MTPLPDSRRRSHWYSSAASLRKRSGHHLSCACLPEKALKSPRLFAVHFPALLVPTILRPFSHLHRPQGSSSKPTHSSRRPITNERRPGQSINSVPLKIIGIVYYSRPLSSSSQTTMDPPSKRRRLAPKEPLPSPVAGPAPPHAAQVSSPPAQPVAATTTATQQAHYPPEQVSVPCRAQAVPQSLAPVADG